MGFVVPVGSWLRFQLHQLVSEYVVGTGQRHDLFDDVVVRKWWSEHQSGMRDRTTELWGLLVFNVWYERFVGTGTATARVSDRPAAAPTTSPLPC
jgi:asparagine synthase (glutamine-hydrolysing)